MSFEMLRQEVDDDNAYIVWKPETADNRFDVYPNLRWQIPEKPFGGDRAPSKTASAELKSHANHFFSDLTKK